MAADEVPDDIALLRDNIADELRAQIALLGRPMDEPDVDQVAYWVAVNLDYVFETKLKRSH